jgi:competence protein ComEA
MRRVVMVACAALLCVPVYMKSRTNQVVPARAAFHALSRNRISVKVSGDVLHPGIYDVSANTLAISVIKMAEPVHPLKQHKIGPVSDGLLCNGSTVTLMEQPDGSHLVMMGQMTVPERMIMGIPLDISTMNEADFDRLPGIGPALAARIIEYRQKNGGILRVEDLKSVNGIGEKKFALIKKYFNTP